MDPDQRIIEERAVTLPLAGRIEIVLVRTVAGDPRTMDFVERAVRRFEEFMGFPFPQQPLIFVLVDRRDGSAFNLGTHIQVGSNREQQADEVQGGSLEGWYGLIAHEIAHHYWSGWQPKWLFEGAATFMELVMSDELHLTPEDAEALLIKSKFGPCTLVENLSELEALPETSASTTDEQWFGIFDCTYLGGAMLFYELYHALDEATFRQAFRRVDLHGLWIAYGLSPSTGECAGESEMGICHVKEAFRTHVSEEDWPTVQEIFDRRYGPTDP